MIDTISSVDVAGKRVLTRVDFNVPLNDDGTIGDDTRIVESLPTINSIIERGGVAILMSHLGRPKGKPNPAYSLRVVRDRLRELLNMDVAFASDCVGDPAEALVVDAKPGSVVLLENLRFHPEEESNDPVFVSQLAKLGDVYCNDAFGTAHRAHASTTGVATLFNARCAGLLMQKELDYLGDALLNPIRPFVSVIGGSKVSSKIDVIYSLMEKCDSILIGGGMMFTFLRALGYETGGSVVEENKIQLASEILEAAKQKNVGIVLPSDVVVASEFSNTANIKTVSISEIPDGWLGLDIGPETAELYCTIIVRSKTIIWNGPMGVFEFSNFASGTKTVSQAMADATEAGAITIVGGGDSAAAVAQFGHQSNVTHVSTGGGASLEFLEGKTLPGVAALEK